MKQRLYTFAPRLAHAISSCGHFLRWRKTRSAAAYAHFAREASSDAGLQGGQQRRLLELPARFMADVELLAYASDRVVLKRCLPLRSTDRAKLRALQGRGVLVASTNFACFYYGLVCCREGFDEVLVVVKSITQENLGLVERIRRLTSIKLEVVSLDKKGFLKMARVLKGGGAVVTMMDTYIGEVDDRKQGVLLEREVFYNATVFDLATKLKATILPLSVFRRGWKFEVDFGDIIDSDGVDSETVAQRSLDQFSERVMRFPDQWMAWPNMSQRLVPTIDSGPGVTALAAQ